jgi:hypothetical protein
MSFGFGNCTLCQETAVVKVNGTPVCVPHMNEVFVGIGDTVRQIAAHMATTTEEER